MKITIIALSLVALASCAPTVGSVKQRWTKDLTAYSFVPMYPPREDVDVGDIRVHLDVGGSQAFDSRLMWDVKAHGQIHQNHVSKNVPAVLPGLESVRLAALDVSSIGILGGLGKVFGSHVEATDSLHVALKDLTTDEISDVHVATKFRGFVGKRLTESPSDIEGFCAAAISLGYDGRLDRVRISIVTRLIRAGSLSYFSGEGVSTIQGSSDPKATGQLNGQPGVAARAAAKIGSEDGALKRNVVIGVDALMLRPEVLNKNLKSICSNYEKIYEYPRLAEFAGVDPSDN